MYESFGIFFTLRIAGTSAEVIEKGAVLIAHTDKAVSGFEDKSLLPNIMQPSGITSVLGLKLVNVQTFPDTVG